MGKRALATVFRATTQKGPFRLRFPIPQGEWALDYRSLFGNYYDRRLTMTARGALILLTLMAGPSGAVQLPIGATADDGLCMFAGVEPGAAKAVLAELTGGEEMFVAVGGSPSVGLRIRPLWQPGGKWSQAWRSFRGKLFGECWRCPRPIRRAVLARDGERCRYCRLFVSGRNLTLDHVRPRAQAGPDTVDNLVVACRLCNNRKNARTPEEAGMVLLPIGGA